MPIHLCLQSKWKVFVYGGTQMKDSPIQRRFEDSAFDSAPDSSREFLLSSIVGNRQIDDCDDISTSIVTAIVYSSQSLSSHAFSVLGSARSKSSNCIPSRCQMTECRNSEKTAVEKILKNALDEKWQRKEHGR